MIRTHSYIRILSLDTECLGNVIFKKLKQKLEL
jgi:hypothetical protein